MQHHPLAPTDRAHPSGDPRRSPEVPAVGGSSAILLSASRGGSYGAAKGCVVGEAVALRIAFVLCVVLPSSASFAQNEIGEKCDEANMLRPGREFRDCS